MNTIAILPEQGGEQPTTFSAVLGERTANGRTAGEALDALTLQLSAAEATAPVVVQQFRPDNFFTTARRDRLSELTARWRAAREAGDTLPPAEQAELEMLVDAEVLGAAERASRMSHELEVSRPRFDYEKHDQLRALHEDVLRAWQLLRILALVFLCNMFVSVAATYFSLDSGIIYRTVLFSESLFLAVAVVVFLLSEWRGNWLRAFIRKREPSTGARKYGDQKKAQ